MFSVSFKLPGTSEVDHEEYCPLMSRNSVTLTGLPDLLLPSSNPLLNWPEQNTLKCLLDLVTTLLKYLQSNISVHYNDLWNFCVTRVLTHSPWSDVTRSPGIRIQSYQFSLLSFLQNPKMNHAWCSLCIVWEYWLLFSLYLMFYDISSEAHMGDLFSAFITISIACNETSVLCL